MNAYCLLPLLYMQLSLKYVHYYNYFKCISITKHVHVQCIHYFKQVSITKYVHDYCL